MQTLVNEYEEEREYGDRGRWTQSVVSIIKLCNKYYQIYWEEALTEYQENSFLDQPIEVRKHTYEKTITVTEWLEVE